MRHIKTIRYRGAAELRRQLASRWAAKWRSVRIVVAGLAALPEPLLHAFSTRHDQIADEFTRMVASGYAARATAEMAAQRATRAPDTVLADEAVREIQLVRLAEIGRTVEAVRALVAERSAQAAAVSDTDVEDMHASPVGQLG